MKRILAIDGGGIRGIIPAMVLAHLEAAAGKPAGTLFDLVAGTSTGGIIACGIAKGVPAQKLVDLYVAGGASIFADPRGELGNLVGPKYSAGPLEAKLAEILGDVQLSQLGGPELIVSSYCITGRAEAVDAGALESTRFPLVFSSAAARGDRRRDFMLKDVARATSAAPTYLPPAAIDNLAGDVFICIDGGVYVNSPTLLAYAESLQIWPNDRERQILSLGTGAIEDPIDGHAAAGWGEVKWITPIISAMMDGSADLVCRLMDELVDHVRLDISLGVDKSKPGAVAEAFDDASPANIAAIQALADTLISSRAGDIQAVLGRLES